MHVLDSTDPAQVKTFENKIDLANTIFIVSSKSGTTLEPNIFKQYFFERVSQTIGADKAAASSPSPIQVRRWSRWPRRINSDEVDVASANS
jgi:glucose-6-phosphate isomerase